MTQKGIFTISLDFELYWGMHDSRPLDDYRENILGVRQAIPAMLDLFEAYNIQATWATVGFLFFEDKDELLANVPDENEQPGYRNMARSPYPKLQNIGQNEQDDPYHYGLSLIRQIAGTPGQRIGTHSFSHYYCRESGQTVDQFRADLAAAKAIAEKRGITIESIIFARNQYTSRYLNVLREFGIKSYRKNEPGWLYAGGYGGKDNPLRRALRLIDCHINLTGHHTYEPAYEEDHNVVSIPSSRFLRPVGRRNDMFYKLGMRRMKSAMTFAAKHGKTFHLWWHPHNFGVNLNDNMMLLTRVLEHYKTLSDRYGMESLNMEAIAERYI